MVGAVLMSGCRWVAACVALSLGFAGTAGAADPQTQTYSTPGQQFTWTVPPGVTQVGLDVVGAAGGLDAGGNGCVPGRGGEVTATVPVTSGDKLTLLVGGAGGNASGGQGGAAGAAGGGAGGNAGATELAFGGGGGGGGSFVKAQGTVVAVAGGGGGCAGSANGSAGDGGNDGAPGQDGRAKGGGDGTQSAAGAGGGSAPTTDASAMAGTGEVGGAGAGSGTDELGGGGGGGGYFGGGGGGATAIGFGLAGGGGGGSDFVVAGATDTHVTSGVGAGDGHITLTFTLPGSTIGQVFTPSRSRPCQSSTLCADYLQLGVETETRYTVPFDGVITAWSFQADASPPVPSTTFIVGRRSSTSANLYSTVGAAQAGAITANELNHYPVRIQVHAGDVIGLSTGDGDFYWNSGPTGDELAEGPIGVAVGSAGTYTTQRFQQDGFDSGGSRLDVSAQVEPDADGDGFGDVSQDACPGVPGSVQGCPRADLAVTQSASASEVPLGGQVTYTLGTVNHGPEEAPSAFLTASLPTGAALVSATTSGGACSFTTTVRCDLGTLAPGSSASVAVTVELNRVGSAVSAARVDSSVLDSAHVKVPDAGDTTPANDTATTNVAVTPATSSTSSGGSSPPGAGQSPSRPSTSPSFAGVMLDSHAITVTGHDALIPLRSEHATNGTLTLATTVTVPARRGLKLPAGHRTIIIGRAAFALSARKVKQVRVRLSGQALALLGAHHVLQVLGTVVATDTFHTSRTTRARLSLRSARKPTRHKPRRL